MELADYEKITSEIITEQHQQAIASMWKLGVTKQTIAHSFPYRPAYIYRYLKGALKRGVLPKRSLKDYTKYKIITLYKGGLTSIYDICEAVQRCRRVVVETLVEEGLITNKPEHKYKKRAISSKTEQIIDEICEGNKTISQIARDYGVSRQYVSWLAKKLKEIGDNDNTAGYN